MPQIENKICNLLQQIFQLENIRDMWTVTAESIEINSYKAEKLVSELYGTLQENGCSVIRESIFDVKFHEIVHTKIRITLYFYGTS